MGFKISHQQKCRKGILTQCQGEQPQGSSFNRINYIEHAQIYQETQIVEEIHVFEEDQELPAEADINENLSTQIPTSAAQCDDADNRNIEEQVIHAYEKEINNLQIKDTLKDYLRRSLRTVVAANENDKLVLLDIRQQLKQPSQEQSTHSTQYTEFLKFIDKLYFLALDKSFSHFQHNQRTTHSFRHPINRLNIARLSGQEQQNNQIERNPLEELLHSESASDEDDDEEQTRNERDTHELRRNQSNSLFPNFLQQQRRELERLSQSLRWRIDSFSNNLDRSRIRDQAEQPAQRDVFMDYLERWPSLVQYMSPSFFRINNDNISNQDNQSQDNNRTS